MRLLFIGVSATSIRQIGQPMNCYPFALQRESAEMLQLFVRLLLQPKVSGGGVAGTQEGMLAFEEYCATYIAGCG